MDIGGAQRQLVELATAMHRAGRNVKVITFYRGGPLEEHLRSAGVPIICLRKGGRWDVVPFMWRLVRVLRRSRMDIVHGYLDVPNILLALLRPLLGRVRIVWGMRASNMDLNRYDAMARFAYRVSVWLSSFADLIICNSDAGRAYHVGQGYSSDRTIVIPNGIDLHHFRPDAEARRQIRAEWGIDTAHRLVGLIARLDVMKDHPTFLHAAARVSAERDDVRFVCLGDGPPHYRDSLAALAASLGLSERLIWGGARNDIWRVYNALDVAVCSSSFGEGFPNAVAEAMATGVPCAVTNVGDAAKLVGESGAICPPRDGAALAQAMLSVLARLPCDPSRIRESIRARYSSAALMDRTTNELERLVECAVPRMENP